MAKKYTIEDIRRFVEEDSGSGCILVSTERQKSGHLQVNLVCKCGEPFNTRFHHFQTRKMNCDSCSGVRHTIGKVRKIAEEKGVKCLSKTYVNNHTNMRFLCKCGNPFTTTLKSLIKQNKTTCDGCTKALLSDRFCKSNEEFDEELFEITKGEIVRVSDYKGTRETILFKHVVCGNVWPTAPGHITNSKSGCPICKESKGEKRIAHYLESQNIKFIRQYKIEECRNKRPLPFDFAVFENERLAMLVEFDGIQHFDKTCFGGKSYENIVRNDSIKNDYCLANSIPLLRIKYTEIELTENILKDALEI